MAKDKSRTRAEEKTQEAGPGTMPDSQASDNPMSLASVPAANSKLAVRPPLPLNVIPLPTENGGVEYAFTSYSPAVEEDGRLVFRAMNADDHKGPWAKDNVFECEHVLIHPWQKEDEVTGEVSKSNRVVMIAPDGTRVAVVSDGVKKALQLACGFKGKPPWNPPIRFKVIEIPTAKGRRFYTLDIVL